MTELQEINLTGKEIRLHWFYSRIKGKFLDDLFQRELEHARQVVFHRYPGIHLL